MVKLWRDQWGTTFAVDEAWATERVAETFERSYRPDGAYRQLLAAAGSLGLWDAQRSIEQPVLIVHGSADPVSADLRVGVAPLCKLDPHPGAGVRAQPAQATSRSHAGFCSTRREGWSPGSSRSTTER